MKQTVNDLIQKYLALDGVRSTRDQRGDVIIPRSQGDVTADDLIHLYLERGGISVTRDKNNCAILVTPERFG